jgi:hypothetical protein
LVSLKTAVEWLVGSRYKEGGSWVVGGI